MKRGSAATIWCALAVLAVLGLAQLRQQARTVKQLRELQTVVAGQQSLIERILERDRRRDRGIESVPEFVGPRKESIAEVKGR